MRADTGVVQQVADALLSEVIAQSRAQLPDEGGDAGRVGKIQRQRRRLAAERFDLRDDGRGFLRIAAVGEHDVGAFAGQRERSAAAEAAVAAGDEGDGVGP